METPLLLRRILGTLFLVQSLLPALADRPFLVAESTSLGDGWFRYRAGSRWNPMINTMTLGSCVIYVATNVWDQLGTNAPGWSFTNQDWTMWTADDLMTPWQIQPYDAVFEIHTPLTSFQQATGIVTMSLTLFELQDLIPYVSGNCVGYWMFPVLIPCPPEQADGSPSSIYSEITYSDVTISRLFMEGQTVAGIQFSNDTYATYLLEATPDLTNWLKVAYLYGDPGITSWTTNSGLNQWGSFFRLQYVGYGHIRMTNLPPLNAPGSLASRTMPNTNEKAFLPTLSVAKGKLLVRLNTAPGQKFEVSVSRNGAVAWSTRGQASAAHTLISLPAEQLPSFGVIRARAIP